MSVDFSQKWVAEAVSELLDKPVSEISAGDMAKIKYMAFGASFQNDFFIEISLEQPPKPFVNSDGGDEWAFCLRGEDISKLVEEYKGKNNVHISMYGLDREDEEWNDIVYSEEAEKAWESFKKSVKTSNYYESFEDDESCEKWDKWYDGVEGSAHKDIELFTGLEVLRVQGLTNVPDLTFLDKLPQLRAIELVETEFVSFVGIEKLERLEQVSCWLD